MLFPEKREKSALSPEGFRHFAESLGHLWVNLLKIPRFHHFTVDFAPVKDYNAVYLQKAALPPLRAVAAERGRAPC